jgi:hypothetical protein
LRTPIFTENMLLYVWPELGKRVAGHFACNSPHTAQRRIAWSVLTFCAPCVGKKIVAYIAHIASVCRAPPSITPRGNECRNDYMPHTLAEHLVRRTEVAWSSPQIDPRLASIALPVETPVSRIL